MKRKIQFVAIFILPLFLCGLYLFFAPPKAHAATITITTTEDEDSDPAAGTGCSIYEAVEAVNNQSVYGGCAAGDGNDDTIVIPSGSYTAATNLLQLTMDATIRGDSGGGTTISGDGSNPVLITLDATVIIEDLTIENGDIGLYVATSGATNTDVTARRLTVENNISSGVFHENASGGTSTLRIYDSVIRASAIAILDSNSDSEYSMDTQVRNTLIEGNATAGLYSLTLGSHLFDRVTLRNNGIGVISTRMTMSNTLVSGNQGGILVYDPGGIGGTQSLTNVTIANNEIAEILGSGLDGPLVAASTESVVFLNLTNVLVANNTDDGGGAINQCGGAEYFDTITNNLSSDNSCTGFEYVNTTPLLAASLADNGGSTSIGSGGSEGNIPSLALLALSPAINAGTSSGCPSLDIRGVSRPQSTTCDIGAFEFVFASSPGSSSGDSSGETESLANGGSLVDTGQNLSILASSGAVLVLGSMLLFLRASLPPRTYSRLSAKRIGKLAVRSR